MGLSKQLSFIAQHILPAFALDNEHGPESRMLPHNHAMNNSSASRAIEDAESAAARRIRQQHPYHPHYQHNLVHNDTRSSYSTPPSLSSSPTHSSPSSTASSSSASSSAPHSGLASPTIGYPYPYQQSQYPYHQIQHPYPYQLQSQQPSSAAPYFQYNNCHSRFGGAQTLGPKGGYSYHRNQSRYQRRKAASTSYYYVDDDDDMMVGYEGHYDDGTHMSDASTPMALPQQQQQKQKSATSSASNAQNGDSSLTAAGSLSSYSYETASLAHEQPSLRARPSLLSSRHSSNTNGSSSEPSMLLPGTVEATTATARSTLTVVSAATATAATRSTDGFKTAQRSLRRIAQCSIDSSDWCSTKAGQYTRSYADTSFKATSYGEGRRMRRM
ncbi:hypothetical protein DFQ26_004683 [Actinomortierella ambigua]|nr:hypothetical protein DFQ26_004683 [Actinomortierella ambigua]